MIKMILYILSCIMKYTCNIFLNIHIHIYESSLHFEYTEQRLNHQGDLKLKIPERNLEHQGSCFTHVYSILVMQDTYIANLKVYSSSESPFSLVQNSSQKSGNPFEWMFQPVDLWDVTFCTCWFLGFNYHWKQSILRPRGLFNRTD